VECDEWRTGDSLDVLAVEQIQALQLNVDAIERRL
jgi:hypothetical protein